MLGWKACATAARAVVLCFDDHTPCLYALALGSHWLLSCKMNCPSWSLTFEKLCIGFKFSICNDILRFINVFPPNPCLIYTHFNTLQYLLYIFIYSLSNSINILFNTRVVLHLKLPEIHQFIIFSDECLLLILQTFRNCHSTNLLLRDAWVIGELLCVKYQHLYTVCTMNIKFYFPWIGHPECGWVTA